MPGPRGRALASLGASVFVLAVLHWVEVPARPAFRVCAFYWLTHRPCPFCGLTRAMFALAKERWTDAIAFHALSPLVMAALLAWAASACLRIVAPERQWPWPPDAARRLWLAGAILFGGYGVVRILFPV